MVILCTVVTGVSFVNRRQIHGSMVESGHQVTYSSYATRSSISIEIAINDFTERIRNINEG
jgi:hypothetical protein